MLGQDPVKGAKVFLEPPHLEISSKNQAQQTTSPNQPPKPTCEVSVVILLVLQQLCLKPSPKGFLQSNPLRNFSRRAAGAAAARTIQQGVPEREGVRLAIFCLGGGVRPGGEVVG